MKPDQARVKQMLTETILLLCKNGLHFQKCMTVQGLLGITLDDKDIFMIHLNEVIQQEGNANSFGQGEGATLENPQNNIVAMRKGCELFVESPDNITPQQDELTMASPPQKFSSVSVNSELSMDKDAFCIKSEPVSDVTNNLEQDETEILEDECEDLSSSAENDILERHGEKKRKARKYKQSIVAGYGIHPSAQQYSGDGFSMEQDVTGGTLYGSRMANCNESDFQHKLSSRVTSRSEIQHQMTTNMADNCANTCNVRSEAASMADYRLYTPSSQFLASGIFVSRYRPKNSADKEYHCTYPGCSLSFYARRTLLRHQTQKHGRPKSYVRYSSRTYGVSSANMGHSFSTS